MTNYLSIIKKRKKNGWKPDEYKAQILLTYGENYTKLRVDFMGDYFALLSIIARYKSFNMTSEWHVVKNGIEVSTEELLSYFDEADRI